MNVQSILEKLNESKQAKQLFIIIKNNPNASVKTFQRLMNFKSLASVHIHRNKLLDLKLIKKIKDGRQSLHVVTDQGFTVYSKLLRVDHGESLMHFFHLAEDMFLKMNPQITKNSKEWKEYEEFVYPLTIEDVESFFIQLFTQFIERFVHSDHDE